MTDLDKLEAIARAGQERSPGPWRRVRHRPGSVDERFDYIFDSSPRPEGFDDYDGGTWDGKRVLETDGGYYEPKGATGAFIEAFSPDVVLALIARIRELETGLHRAVHAGFSLHYAYEESHIWSMLNELEKAGALVGRKPGDPSPR
jgi:hypothetical protein